MHLAHLPRIGSLISPVAGIAHRLAQPRNQKTRTPNTIGELLAVEDILLDVVIDNKSDLVEQIGQHMESVHGMDCDAVAPALHHRERIGSTALGQGVALPHARIVGLERIHPLYLRLKFPIPFDAPDGLFVSDVLVLLVPKRATQEHLDILAQASQLLSDRRFRERLHECKQPMEAKRLFEAGPDLPA